MPKEVQLGPWSLFVNHAVLPSVSGGVVGMMVIAYYPIPQEWGPKGVDSNHGDNTGRS